MITNNPTSDPDVGVNKTHTHEGVIVTHAYIQPLYYSSIIQKSTEYRDFSKAFDCMLLFYDN